MKEFKPTILFLLKFIGWYAVTNILYGLAVEAFQPEVDPYTSSITRQVAGLMNVAGMDITTYNSPAQASACMVYSKKAIIAVHEGCNGINIMIVFTAFLFSFGPITRALWWFAPVGLVIIYVSNLLRIMGLFLIGLHTPQYLYFTHKFLFTGILYLIIFGLWWLWIRLNKR